MRLSPSPARPTLSKFGVSCILLAGLIGLTLIFCVGASAIYDAYVASAGWRPIGANVVASGTARGCGKGGHRFTVDLRYRYRVDGVDYSGGQLRFGSQPCGSESAMAATASRWPVGADVTAFYDPAHPASSVLVKEVAADTIVITAGFFGAIICWLYFIALFIRKQRKATGKLGWG